MNEFTKEELGLILDAFHYAKDSACWTKYHNEPVLINKLQFKIDNYCDHENRQWLTPNHVICICNYCKRVLDE